MANNLTYSNICLIWCNVKRYKGKNDHRIKKNCSFVFALIYMCNFCKIYSFRYKILWDWGGEAVEAVHEWHELTRMKKNKLVKISGISGQKNLVNKKKAVHEWHELTRMKKRN